MCHIYHLWRNVYSNFLVYFLLGYYLSFLLSCKNSLHVLDMSSLMIQFYKHLHSFLELSFRFLEGLVCSTKVLNFDVVQFIYFVI